MSVPITQFAYLTATEADLTTVQQALTDLCQKTRQEDACSTFDFYQSADNAKEFVLHERFSHQEGYDQHLAAEYTQAFFQKKVVCVDRVVAVSAVC